MPCLAVATPQFLVSETFIANHITTIAPGSTVVICNDDPADALDHEMPFLDNKRGWRDIAGRVCRRLRVLGPFLKAIDSERRVRFIKTQGVKVILAEYLDFAIHLISVSKRANVPLYAYAHGYDVARGERDSRLKARYTELFAEASGIVVASSYMSTKLAGLGCPVDKIHIIPCGIDPSIFRPTTAEPGCVLAVGRLVEKKAPHLTIEAFAQVLHQHPSSHLYIIGEGPLRERCEAAISRFSIADSVHLLGAQPQEVVRTYLKRAALFVQHSLTAPNGDTEGLGVALLEAMASEIPVVTTRHNGFIDTVADGETGYLVEEGDVQAMSAAMSAILGNPRQARRLGAAGRSRVSQKFALESTAARMRLLFGLKASYCGADIASQEHAPT